MDKELKKKLLVKEKWFRGLFMVLFLIIKYIVSWLIVLIAILQFIIDLFASEPNEKLVAFTQGLNTYLYQIVNYLTFNTETKPFPFSHWPDDKIKKEPARITKSPAKTSAEETKSAKSSK